MSSLDSSSRFTIRHNSFTIRVTILIPAEPDMSVLPTLKSFDQIVQEILDDVKCETRYVKCERLHEELDKHCPVELVEDHTLASISQACNVARLHVNNVKSSWSKYQLEKRTGTAKTSFHMFSAKYDLAGTMANLRGKLSLNPKTKDGMSIPAWSGIPANLDEAINEACDATLSDLNTLTSKLAEYQAAMGTQLDSRGSLRNELEGYVRQFNQSQTDFMLQSHRKCSVFFLKEMPEAWWPSYKSHVKLAQGETLEMLKNSDAGNAYPAAQGSGFT